MSHKAGHEAYDNYKNQSRPPEVDYSWNMRKKQIREHARNIRERIGRGTPRDYLAFAKGMHKDVRNYKGVVLQLERNLFSKSAYDLYKSGRSRKWLKKMHGMIQASIVAALEGNIDGSGVVGEKQKTRLVTQQMLEAGFQHIAREETRYRNQQARQRRANSASKHQWSPSPQKPNDYTPAPQAYVRTPEVNSSNFN